MKIFIIRFLLTGVILIFLWVFAWLTTLPGESTKESMIWLLTVIVAVAVSERMVDDWPGWEKIKENWREEKQRARERRR